MNWWSALIFYFRCWSTSDCALFTSTIIESRDCLHLLNTVGEISRFVNVDHSFYGSKKESRSFWKSFRTLKKFLKYYNTQLLFFFSIRYISSAITMHMTNLFWFLSWCLFVRKSFISLFIFRTNLQIPTYRKFLCWSLRWILYTILYPPTTHGRRGAFIIEYFKICLTMQLVIKSF